MSESEETGLRNWVRAGDTIYLAGQLPLDAEGRVVGPGDVRAQALQAVENLKQALAEAGASMDDIVRLWTYTTHFEHRADIWDTRAPYFAKRWNSSVLCVVPALWQREVMVCFDATAYVGGPRRVIQPENLHYPIGRNYVHGHLVGRTLYVAGQVGTDKDENVAAGVDIQAFLKQTMENLNQVLLAAGGSLDDVVKLTTLVQHAGYVPAVHAVRDPYFRQMPADTLVVGSFGRPQFLVEIDAIAVLGERREVIGSSQAVRVADTVYVSGQRPVGPQGSLVGRGDVVAQTRQILDNLNSVLSQAGATPDDVTKLNIFTTHPWHRDPILSALKEAFEQPLPPVTFAVVAGLACADFMVEIDAVAVIR